MFYYTLLWLSTTSDQFSRDDDALNMTGPLVDLQPLDVTVVALNGVIIRIATIAVHQHRFRSCLHRGFCGKKLGNGGCFGSRQALILHPGGMVNEQPRCFHIGGHVCQSCLNHLEVSDTLAE